MGRFDDQRQVTLCEHDGTRVEGVMRVAGLEAFTGGRRLRYERRAPQSVTVRRAGETGVIRLPSGERSRTLAILAVPMAAVAIRRLFAAHGGRR